MPKQPKIPQPYRRKNWKGKEQGSYYCKVRGQEINLATKDPDEAWRRAAAAKRDNKRNFKEDADAAADAAIEARTKPISPPTPPDELAAARAAAAAATAEAEAARAAATTPATSSAPPVAPAPPAAPSASSAQAPPSPQPEIPAPAAEGPAHEKVEEAAREATQERDTAEAPPPQPPPGMQFDPAFMDMIAKQGAQTIVELQLMLQAWIVFKRTGDKPGQVPKEAIAFPVQLWEHQLKIWISRWQFDLPPWAVALFLTSMCYPLQHAARTKKAPAGNLGSVVDADFSETPPFRKAA